MVKKAKMPKKTSIHTRIRSLFFSSFSYFLMQSSSLQTRSSAFGDMSMPQTRQCLCEGICACALERFGMFLTFCFTADASTIKSLRLNQGSLKWASFQCIFNPTDVTSIKNANSQPTLDGPIDCNWVNSSALTRFEGFFASNVLQLA